MKNNSPTILDFIRKMRIENENEAQKKTSKIISNESIIDDKNDDNDVTSTQNMIKAARLRRELRGKETHCENCDFQSASEHQMKAHAQN